MNQLFNEFQKTARKESDLYDLVLADQRVMLGGCAMERDGFDRFLIYAGNGKNIVLQAEHHPDGCYNISIQGEGRYVMFSDERFMELLKQF